MCQNKDALITSKRTYSVFVFQYQMSSFHFPDKVIVKNGIIFINFLSLEVWMKIYLQGINHFVFLMGYVSYIANISTRIPRMSFCC